VKSSNIPGSRQGSEGNAPGPDTRIAWSGHLPRVQGIAGNVGLAPRPAGVSGHEPRGRQCSWTAELGPGWLGLPHYWLRCTGQATRIDVLLGFAEWGGKAFYTGPQHWGWTWTVFIVARLFDTHTCSVGHWQLSLRQLKDAGGTGGAVAKSCSSQARAGSRRDPGLVWRLPGIRSGEPVWAGRRSGVACGQALA